MLKTGGEGAPGRRHGMTSHAAPRGLADRPARESTKRSSEDVSRMYGESRRGSGKGATREARRDNSQSQPLRALRWPTCRDPGSPNVIHWRRGNQRMPLLLVATSTATRARKGGEGGAAQGVVGAC